MRYNVTIPGLDGVLRSFYLLRYADIHRIDVDSVVILDIVKHHNHRYDLQGFFYCNKLIVGPYSFRSKRELHGAVQKLLQENLNIDVQ